MLKKSYLPYLFLPLMAVVLASWQQGRDTLMSFYRDPSLSILHAYDNYASSSQKQLLAEHLPGVFQPSFACQKVQGEQKKPVFAGDIIESGSDPIWIRCSSGLSMRLEKKSKIRLTRESDSAHGVSLFVGSIFVRSNNRKPFYLSEEWGSLRLVSQNYFSFLLTSKGPVKEIVFLSGDVSIKPKLYSVKDDVLAHLIYFSAQVDATVSVFDDDSEQEMSAVTDKVYALDGWGRWVLAGAEEKIRLPNIDSILAEYSFEHTEMITLHAPRIIQRGPVMGGVPSLSFEFSWALSPYPASIDVPCIFSLFSDEELRKNSMKINSSNWSVKGEKIFPGNYFWTVDCSLDEKKFFSNKQAFVINAAAVIRSPANDTTIQGGTVTIAWDSFYEASQYELQFSSKADFSSMSKMTVFGTSIRVQLAPGNYYWRVLAQAKDNSYLSFPQEVPQQLKIE